MRGCLPLAALVPKLQTRSLLRLAPRHPGSELLRLALRNGFRRDCPGEEGEGKATFTPLHFVFYLWLALKWFEFGIFAVLFLCLWQGV